MISKISAKNIKGCHPTLTSAETYDNWAIMSLLEYYSIQTKTYHPNPADCWRYKIDNKWGWKLSITDYKTQSIKEFHKNNKIIKNLQRQFYFHLLCIHAVLKPFPNTSDIPGIITDYLYLPFKQNNIDKFKQILKEKEPTSLPCNVPINPMCVFLGRLKQFQFIHEKTNSSIIEITQWNTAPIKYDKYTITFEQLTNACSYNKHYSYIYIKTPHIIIKDKQTLLRIIYGIYKADNKNVKGLSNLLECVNYNFTRFKCPENYNKYSAGLNEIQKGRLQLPSTVDTWIADLFGW